MDDFKKAYKKLNRAQQDAVDTTEGPIMVLAGPGTGKTQLLALRAAHILATTDAQPQNILCLTYTENGAKNMRERLIRYIGQAAYDIRISTYHGFGSDIIREFGEYFTGDELGEPVDALGQHTIMQAIYAQLPASNVLWRDTYLRDALQLISEYKRAELTPDDVRVIAQDNIDFINEASKFASSCLESFQRMSKSSAPLFGTLLDALEALPRKPALPRDTKHLQDLAANELRNAVMMFEDDGKTTKPLTEWKNKWLMKDTDDAWSFGGAREAQKMLGGADIYEHYTALLTQKKLFDYDDMILRAIRGLETQDDVRYTLQERYLYIMLDEFQDTNPAQLDLIRLLTNNPVSEGRPNVLAVGDDDQAIFSFQGADHTNMLRFYDMYRDVKTVTLTENWRSHADIVSTAHSLAETISLRLHRDPRIGIMEKALVAVNPELQTHCTMERVQFVSDIAQYDWVAKQIAEKIKAGTPPSEIAVIAPKHKYLEPLVPYLSKLNIPVRYEKRENVLQEPTIQELITMARLVTALREGEYAVSDALWPGVLSAAYWQLPVSSIWQLSWRAGKLRYTPGADAHWHMLMMEDPLLRPIALFFAKLALMSKTETLETMLDYLIGMTKVELYESDLPTFTSPYFDHYFTAGRPEHNTGGYLQLISNLTVLRSHLRDYHRDELRPLQLDDLLAFVEEYTQAGEKLLNTNPYHGASDAVELLTAYGAKGLEFDCVFVLAVNDDVWGTTAKNRSNIITLPHNLQYIRRAGSTRDEKIRLFFVAVSRAKTQLYLTNYDQDYSGKTYGSLAFMQESEQEDGNVVSNILPASRATVRHNKEKGVPAEAVASYWYQRHIDGLTDGDFKKLLQPLLDGFQLSPTHLGTFTDLVYGGPQQFYLRNILKFPGAASPDSKYGDAMHETMYDIHKHLRSNHDLPEPEEVQKMFEARLLMKRLSAADHERHLQRGAQALEVFLPAWWQNFLLESEHERDFRDEGSFVGKAHLTGRLDQLMKNTDDKDIYIIDFKTGTSHAYWEKTPKMHKYKQQLLFYKLLVEGSHSYKGYTASAGKLVFVEPDSSGKINEVVITYDNEDLTRTKQLIEAIWTHIHDLNFPDVSHYPKTLKGIEQFEQDLIDGKI